MQKIEFSESSKFKNALRRFCEQAVVSGDLTDIVTSVLSDVGKRGDLAVLEYTGKFDHAKLTAKTMRLRLKTSKLRSRASVLPTARPFANPSRWSKTFIK